MKLQRFGWYFKDQGLIEVTHLEDEERCGFVTDIVKASESLPRAPVFALCAQLGVPTQVIRLWETFLATVLRRFRVNEIVGPPLTSTSGFPERCGMSCMAMAVVNISYQMYMRAFCPAPIALSYVDNLEIVAEDCAALGQGILCLQAWADLWLLDLDIAKTYVGEQLQDAGENWQCWVGLSERLLRILVLR